MAHFGLTRHGDYNQLLNSQPAHRPAGFAEIADQTFEDEFEKHVLGDCAESRALEIDGSCHILRKSLLDILRHVLGRPPIKSEFDVFFTWFNFDGSGVMSRCEYGKAVTALKTSCAKRGEQREWHSYTTKHTDWLRHKRLSYEPQDTLNADVTEAQKIGWHAVKPQPAKDKFMPAGSTDVTQREGRSLADYYGVYTLIGLQQ